MFFIQPLGPAASLLILLTQPRLLHMDSISVKSQSFCFSFVFDWSCVPLVPHSHLRAFARQFVAFLPLRVHVLDADWYPDTRQVGRRPLEGWATALNCSWKQDSLVPKASSQVRNKYDLAPLTLEWSNDFHMMKPQKLRPEKSHAEPGYETGLDRIFSCHPWHH